MSRSDKEHKPWRRVGHIKRRLRRRQGIWYEYNRDGISDYEYVDGFWRRYWRKWFSRLSIKQDMLDANEELNHVDTTG
jgi:hypothetical protein